MYKTIIGCGLSLAFIFLASTCLVSAQDIKVTIHLRGVYESKISLVPLTGDDAYKPILERTGVKGGGTTTLTIGKERLPAIFVLRFDYKEFRTSTPYPCEKQIIINNQNLELRVHPMYCNNPDSALFQVGEVENTMMAGFVKENSKRRERTSALQNFLLTYPDTKSKFYRQGVKEYEKQRKEYNRWLTELIRQNSELFTSRIFRFHYLPEIKFQGDEIERIRSLIDNYFDGMDFGDPLMLKTTELKGWMDNYVNMHASLMARDSDLDSLFTLAGYRAIETARNGHPLVYGWMVDYFFRGYESINIEMGIRMLEPYLNDTLCLTSKRQAIEKRLKGISNLTVGTPAPDFLVSDDKGNPVSFNNYPTDKRYKLILFWSADCGHCQQMMNELRNWQQQSEEKGIAEIFALNLDDAGVDEYSLQKITAAYPDWVHIRCDGGINSYEADAWFVLSTPVMFLVEAATNKIAAVPGTVQQLLSFINSQE